MSQITARTLKVIVTLTLFYPCIHYYGAMIEMDRRLPQMATPHPWAFHEKGSGGSTMDLQNATVLITGAAGFIGFSVAAHMFQHGLGRVIGIDNFNEYYDVGLKYKRADMLSRWEGMELVNGDVCDAGLLRNLLEKHQVTHVLHLAAQAGVRYSLDNPLAYVRENVECFVTLLEELRHLQNTSRPLPRLVYASSSSVYSSNTKVPYEEADAVDQPSSLYGATKRMDELLGLVYFKIFGIPSIGLRFFTVYGPWGRPDMAPYIFTEKIEKGQTITVYNHGNMKRDFTFIDDIVKGIIAALAYPASSAEVINLGNNKPESVLQLVKIIEKRLGKVAQLDFKDSVVDLPITYASTSKANTVLSYEPQTSLEEGMVRFIDWYLLNSGERRLCASECADPEHCLASRFDAVQIESMGITEGCTIVVYTIYVGNAKISLHEPLYGPSMSKDGHKVCYVAFTSSSVNDGPSSAPSKWRQVSIQSSDVLSNLWNVLSWDNRRLSRVIKLTPGFFFASSVSHAIYVDAKLELQAEANELIGLLDDPASGKHAVLVAIRHPFDSSPYEEAEAIKRSKRGDRPDISYSPWTMEHQMTLYEKAEREQNVSMPTMIDGAFLIHDLRNHSGRVLRCAWSKEFYAMADRDQLSFPYVLARLGKEAGTDHAAGEEWCKINQYHYVRILPSVGHHWWKGSNVIAENKGLFF